MGKFQHLEQIRSLAVVGATGLAGQEFIELLGEYKIRVGRLKLLASESSLGHMLNVFDGEQAVDVLNENSFEDVEMAFFSVPTEISRKYAPIAIGAGCTVIDDSNAFRMDPDVPLIVPEVNGDTLRDFQGLLLSTPNCSTTPLAMVVKPLDDHFGVHRVVASTYQSVSGAGKKAYEELSKQTVALISGGEADRDVFSHRIAFNCLPKIGPVLDNGSSEEEQKMVNELRKILDLPDLPVSATAVRVPTFCGHGLSVNLELRDDFGDIEKVREILEAFPGIKVVDNPSADIFPTNAECVKSDYTFVGRIRRDHSVQSGINLWVITDNLRKGAALNALESLDTLYGYRRLN